MTGRTSRGYIESLGSLTYSQQWLVLTPHTTHLLRAKLLLALHPPPDQGGRVGLLAGADQAHVTPDLGPVWPADVDSVPRNWKQNDQLGSQKTHNLQFLHALHYFLSSFRERKTCTGIIYFILEASFLHQIKKERHATVYGLTLRAEVDSDPW